jgi:hypothetical protein
MKHKIQIDVVKGEQNGVYACNLYTGQRCVRMYIHQHDYESLINDGFFIRDGKKFDSANVLNTTNVFNETKE